MEKIELHEVIGLGRSGHHAFMNWIVHNLTGVQIEWQFKFTRVANTGFFILDEGSHDLDASFHFMKENLSDITSLMVGYEESTSDFSLFSPMNKFLGPNSVEPIYGRNFDYKSRTLIIRDFFNILASRIKKNQDSGYQVFDVRENFIETWKEQARSCVSNKIEYIKFEEWTSNSLLRKSFFEKNFNSKELVTVERVKGTRSSFENRNQIHSRYQQITIPEEIKSLIDRDKELFYLMGKLGYEYRMI